MRSWLPFLHAIERLKKELRHSYLSNGRQEDVAEHSWRMAVMAISLCPKNLDREKAVEMAIVHDLCEVFAGDVYALKKNATVGKHEKELKAMGKLAKLLPDRKIAKQLYEASDADFLIGRAPKEAEIVSIQRE